MKNLLLEHLQRFYLKRWMEDKTIKKMNIWMGKFQKLQIKKKSFQEIWKKHLKSILQLLNLKMILDLVLFIKILYFKKIVRQWNRQQLLLILFKYRVKVLKIKIFNLLQVWMLLVKNLHPLNNKKPFLQIREKDKKLGNLAKLFWTDME